MCQEDILNCSNKDLPHLLFRCSYSQFISNRQVYMCLFSVTCVHRRVEVNEFRNCPISVETNKQSQQNIQTNIIGSTLSFQFCISQCQMNHLFVRSSHLKILAANTKKNVSFTSTSEEVGLYRQNSNKKKMSLSCNFHYWAMEEM